LHSWDHASREGSYPFFDVNVVKCDIYLFVDFYYALLQVRGKATVTCAAGGSFVAQPSSRRKAAKKDFPPDEKLASLRKEFEKAADNKGLDAYIVPSEDAHQVNNIFYSSAILVCNV
jgi:hypothetical protein